MRESINIDDEIKFGCEVEFNCSHDAKFFEKEKKLINSPFKIDNNCNGSKIKEAISSIMTKKDLTSLRDILELINKYGGYIKGDEGAHIHFDSNIVNEENIMSLLKLWYASEKTIYKFAKCDNLKLRKLYYIYAHEIGIFLKPLIIEFENGRINLDLFKAFAKNSGLNLKNYIEHNPCKDTIEIRVPNGTLNYEVWLNNIDFFGNLLSYSNNINNKEYIDYIFNKDLELNEFELSNLIFKNDDSKKYFLKQINGDYIMKNNFDIKRFMK